MDQADVRELRTALKLVQRRLRREVLATQPLSRSALQVLGALSRAGGGSPGALAAELHMTSSNVAATLRGLERAGHVDRSPEAGDRRRVRVALTAAGRRVVAELRDERDTWLGRAIAAELDDDEQQLLLRVAPLLTRLAGHEQGTA